VIAPLKRPVLAFAGGGTGGHLFPAMAVARALPSLEPVFLVPEDRGDDRRLRGEFRHVSLPMPRPDRSRLLYPAALARAIARSRRALRDVGARAVVGLGGYASVPGCVAARTLGLPVYLMELNAVPGRATRLLARMARGIGLGSGSARAALPRGLEARVTGTPLRRELLLDAMPRDFGLRDGVPTLLVLGGSQGAASLNRRVVEALPRCADLRFQVLHCAGEADAAALREAYARSGVAHAVVDFLPDIGRAYSVADLVLARGGASTVAECLARGRPAVFVPYPWHRDQQQARNAEPAVASGAARLVRESDLTPDALRTIVQTLLIATEERARMARAADCLARPDAAGAMASHLIETLAGSFPSESEIPELGG
jgi:UDP-N-acetylglucosamine--N-acetylmuramyl-(pentapeptide) pyrophosphoryl-undecaprenol N-acetylglucosamine transferase